MGMADVPKFKAAIVPPAGEQMFPEINRLCFERVTHASSLAAGFLSCRDQGSKSAVPLHRMWSKSASSFQ